MTQNIHSKIQNVPTVQIATESKELTLHLDASSFPSSDEVIPPSGSDMCELHSL